MIVDLICDDSEIDEIRQKGQESDRLSWYFGDKVNSIWGRVRVMKSAIIAGEIHITDETETRLILANKGNIEKDVSILAGKRARTIRDYASLAEFYPDEKRSLFLDLPFSHFRFARGFPKYAFQILQLSLVEFHKRDRVARSVEWLEMNFRKVLGIDEGGGSSFEDVESTLEVETVITGEDMESAAVEVYQENIPLPPLVYHMLKSLPRVTNYIKRALRAWEIPPENRARLLELVEMLEVGILELAD